MTPLGPGALADRIVTLPVSIEAVEVSRRAVPIPGYHDDDGRPSAVVTLRGGGLAGRGECVAWTVRNQDRFAEACTALVPLGPATVGSLGERLADVEPYYRAAIEAAAIDLALRQARTNLFVVSRRLARPVAFCRSLGRKDVASAGGPAAAVSAVLARDPDARIKIDVDPSGWGEYAWSSLAATGRVVVLDFKREGRVEQVALAHAWLPDAWLEDPPRAALDPHTPWRARISLDGYVGTAQDLAPPPVMPGAINVKPARMGGPLEALRALEACAREGWAAYVGGMFEVGPGRAQARVLASLYTSESWNDLAPLVGEPHAKSPLEMPLEFVGFGTT